MARERPPGGGQRKPPGGRPSRHGPTATAEPRPEIHTGITVHVAFITAATLLSVGCGVWALQQYLHTASSSYLLLAIFSLIGTVALPIYGSWFLKKMKKVSFV